MSLPTESTSTRYAADVSARIPPRDAVQGIVELAPRDRAIWELAAPHLDVRDNDVHSLYAYGLAAALQALLPGSRAEIVLPAILLHDTGWSTVPDKLILAAIAPGGGRPDLVRRHETEGARIARQILGSLDFPETDIEEIAAIIDGHDSRPEALSPDDAIVKDADKLWRLTPHGLRTVQGWFGLDADQALRLCCARVHDSLFTEPARAMARGLAAVASLDLAPERTALG
ncbi:HD domain-containing protein [Arthrobacter sp. GCM10027362]|uniref:HD domain-containing protein n=1 Tax=Arthrobacter sp. GCM10027362 TaxID=3273379 RepID=UPI0036435F6D